jgi:hypothetical protein
MPHIQHHPGQPSQQGQDAGEGGKPRQIAKKDLDNTDFLHNWRPLLLTSMPTIQAHGLSKRRIFTTNILGTLTRERLLIWI